jgi:hypothetical protein
MQHKNSTFREVAVRRGLGGWGDVQMALAVAELLARELGITVTFGCPKDLLPLCENVPSIEALACRTNNAEEDAPLEAFDLLTFGKLWDITTPCIEYEKALQPNVDRNRTEIWATKLGLKGKPYPRVYLTDKERAYASAWVKKYGLEGRFLLGVIPRSYSWIRDWPAWYKLLWQLKATAPLLTPVIFLAGVDDWNAVEYAVCGVPVYRPQIREHLALMDRCHMIAGVDTGPMHSAVGLGKHTLWVFSHIDGKIRTQGYSKAKFIQRTDLDCCPCWYDQIPRCHDPRYFALCRSIAVEEVEREIIKKYRRWLCFTSFSRMVQRRPKPSSVTGITSPKTAV